MRRIQFAVACLALLLAGCGGVADQAGRGPSIDCETTSRGRLLLFAQAVPNAEMIPCLRALPPGWGLLDIVTSSEEASIDFENDTYDVDVVVTFRERCSGIEPASLQPGEVTLERTPAASFYRFTGGCVAVEPHGPLGEEALEGLFEAIDFLTRAELSDRSGWEL